MSHSGPPPSCRSSADVVAFHLHGELRIEEARLADALLAHQIRDLEIAALEVQPVGGHQLHVVALAGVDHAFAVAHAGSQRLLAQHVQAGFGRAHSPLRVLGVGRRDVDGVDGAAVEQLVRVGIRYEALDAVSAPSLFNLAWVPETSAVSSTCGRAWRKAGRTAACAIWPSPITAKRSGGADLEGLFDGMVASRSVAWRCRYQPSPLRLVGIDSAHAVWQDARPSTD